MVGKDFIVEKVTNGGPDVRITITHIPTGLSETAVGTSEFRTRRAVKEALIAKIEGNGMLTCKLLPHMPCEPNDCKYNVMHRR